ncbi:MAG TPA: PKD domain-containing protein [Thermoplasmatales archaeon]|nr:PKD domain-containing protein [Thermoplasmatales archaeon]
MKKIIGFLICMLLIIPISGILADWNPGDPYKMHFPQLPDPLGWDVDATYVEEVWPQNCLADDWLCTETGPVSDIHFWGSWLNDNIGNITAFSIAIAADIPADPPEIPYSRPGATLWERTFYPTDWVVAGPWEGSQGWYDPGEGFYIPDNHILYWQYNIENIEDPFIQTEGTIYWLSVSAIVEPASPQPRWGWKSSDDHWNDDAVHGFWYELDWTDLYEPPDFETSLDLAFVITGEESMNTPPNTPSKPSGPSTGETEEWLTYSTSTTDPDDDLVRYGWDVDSDGIVDYWSTSYYPSGATHYVNIMFHSPGVYYLRVKAEDIHGAQSGFSPSKQVIISGANNPPSKPSTPDGPSYGKQGVSYTYTTSTTDPDGDNVRYGWDWDGDGTIDEWTSYYHSGSTVSVHHTWLLPGVYNVRVKAEDENGAQSDFSLPKTVVISANSPPAKPAMPSGPTYGRPGISYTYTTSTTDPDGDQIYYMFDWDDGSTSGWIGPHNSGETISASHIWNTKGTYSVKVKAIDDPNGDGDISDGLESVWSDPLPVSMPKSYILYLLEQHLPKLSFLNILRR